MKRAEFPAADQSGGTVPDCDALAAGRSVCALGRLHVRPSRQRRHGHRHQSPGGGDRVRPAPGPARHRAGNRGDPPAAARPKRCAFCAAARSRRDADYYSLQRLRRQQVDGQDRPRLPDRYARHSARHRARRPAPRRPCLRLATPAGPRGRSRARSSPMAGSPAPPTPASSSTPTSIANMIGRLAILGVEN